MGGFYGEKILAGLITMEDVPKYWRKKVQTWLDENAPEEGGAE